MSPAKKKKLLVSKPFMRALKTKKTGTGVGALHESSSVVASELPSSLAAVPGTSV
jgi:hypothetical protein